MNFLVNPYLPFVSGGHVIPQSVRIYDGTSSRLTRTVSGTTSNRVFTWEFWVKRCELGRFQRLWQCTGAGSANTEISFSANDQLQLDIEPQGGGASYYLSNMRLRDTSAWYHIVVSIDQNQTDSNHVVAEVNGEPVTWASGSPPSSAGNLSFIGYTCAFFSGVLANHWQLNGYCARAAFIDGTKYGASDFGETDSNGNWVPKDISDLTWSGNESALFLFQDSSNFGDDSSGNANDWTPVNFASTDQVSDSPTDDADNGVGNYCTWNPNYHHDGTISSYSEGNLNITGSNGCHTLGTIGFTGGKFYWEITIPSYNSAKQQGTGVVNQTPTTAGANPVFEASWWFDWGGTPLKGDHVVWASGTSHGSSGATNSVMMCAVDADNGKIWWGKDGTWFNSGNPATGTNAAFTNLSGTLIPFIEGEGAYTLNANFGQLGFAHTPPSGFKALCTANLPAPAIADPSAYFNVVPYTGTDDSQNITGFGFDDLDLAWIKGRSNAGEHYLWDRERGTGSTKNLCASRSDAEGYNSAYHNFAWYTDGFTITQTAPGNEVNKSGLTYVAYGWKAGATPGFEILSFVGNGTNRTISHSLGVAPAMMIFKNRDGGDNWEVYHEYCDSNPEWKYLQLNNTNAASGTNSHQRWNDTKPTSSVVHLGTGDGVNQNGKNIIGYLFAEAPGFSKAFKYKSNASTDGPYIWCGFSPAFILIKQSDVAGNNWVIYDIARNTHNVADAILQPNVTTAEVSGVDIDVLSTGFKIRTTDSRVNTTGSTREYIGIAFAEFPFGGAGVSQARAR